MNNELLHHPSFNELLQGGKREEASQILEDDLYQGTQSVSNLDNSHFLHSRLNLMDDQVTINYDLSAPSLPGMDQKKDKVKKKRLSKQ